MLAVEWRSGSRTRRSGRGGPQRALGAVLGHAGETKPENGPAPAWPCLGHPYHINKSSRCRVALGALSVLRGPCV
eukprot:3780604-Lingulodinium_polyedra.AAC.1